MSGTLLIVIIAGLLAIFCGWLVPILFKSRRPYGLLGDILVCTLLTVIVSYLSWTIFMPALGFKDGWIKVLGSVGDPLFLGLVGLWLIRKIKG
jgi:hypothetical protein